MRKANIVLTTLLVAIGLTDAPRAQEPHDRPALDQGYNNWFVGDYEVHCYVYVWDVGGSTFNAGAGLSTLGGDHNDFPRVTRRNSHDAHCWQPRWRTC